MPGRLLDTTTFICACTDIEVYKVGNAYLHEAASLLARRYPNPEPKATSPQLLLIRFELSLTMVLA